MELGTAAGLFNTLLKTITDLTGKGNGLNAGSILSASNNPLASNKDLHTAISTEKLNKLFAINGNMIALKKDVIVEPLLVISESAFDSKEYDKIAHMMLDTFVTHYADTFNTLQNVYGIDSHTIITVLGTDNGFGKLMANARTAARTAAVSAIASQLRTESGLSDSFAELMNLKYDINVEEDVQTESAMDIGTRLVPSASNPGKKARMNMDGNIKPEQYNEQARKGVLTEGMLERRLIITLRPSETYVDNNLQSQIKEREENKKLEEQYKKELAIYKKELSDYHAKLDTFKKTPYDKRGEEPPAPIEPTPPNLSNIENDKTNRLERIKNLGYQIPITIKARVLRVSTENIAQVSEPNKKFSTLSTWLDKKAGLTTLFDYLFQREAVKKYKKNLFKGNEFLKTINERKLSAYSKVATNSIVGFELNYTLMVITQRDKQLLDRYLGLNIFKEKEKDDFLSSVYALGCAVLDDDAEMCTFLTPQVRGLNTVTYRELRRFSGQKDFDVSELLMTIMKTRSF